MEALGLDWKLLIAQVINFGVLFFVLSKLLYKPLINFLDFRKKKIEETLTKSKKIEEELEKIKVKEKEMLGTARKEAEKEREELIKLAQIEKQKILDDAKELAEVEARKGIQKIEAAQLAAEKALRERLAKGIVEEVTQKFTPKKGAKRSYPILKELLK